jgi:hypothetical protein
VRDRSLPQDDHVLVPSLQVLVSAGMTDGFVVGFTP